MPINCHRVIRQHHRFPTSTEDPGAVAQDIDPLQASNHQTVLDVRRVPPAALSTSGEKQIDPACAAKKWGLNDRQNAQTLRN